MKEKFILTIISLAVFLNNSSAQQFPLGVMDTFNLSQHYVIGYPELVDINGDGDEDLFLGDWYSALRLFDNVGTPQSPFFAPSTFSMFGLPSFWAEMPIVSFGDIDNDGDYDAFISDLEYPLYCYFNGGSPTTPNFNSAIPWAFGVQDSGIGPKLVDIDSDGDLDLFGFLGMRFWENVGSSTSAQFASPVWGPFGLDSTVGAQWNWGDFADLDFDNDMDLVTCDEHSGKLKLYENVGTPSSPFFQVYDSLYAFGAPCAQCAVAPALSDIDSDGDYDLLVHSVSGHFYYFENNSPVGLGEFCPPFLLVYPNPTHDLLTVESDGDPREVHLYSMNGQEVLSTTSRTISIGHLPRGSYLLSVLNSNGRWASQVIELK